LPKRAFSEPLIRRTGKGAWAGFLATAPMTGVMAALFRRLPSREKHPLPPRQATQGALESIGLKEYLNEPERQATSLLFHFAYGLAAGALYTAAFQRPEWPPVRKGMVYGIAVWAGSYFGWLRLFDRFRPAARQSPRRHALMAAAHLVWGAGLGFLAEQLSSSRKNS
jgi:hypothetical protein